jgi:ribonuclease E
MDADGKPTGNDGVNLPEAPVSAADAPAAEARTERPSRNGERGERGERNDRGERSRGERRPERSRRPDEAVRPDGNGVPEGQQADALTAGADVAPGVEGGEQQAEGGARSQEPRERRPRGRDRDRGPRPERGERSDRGERTERPEPVGREDAAANEETSAEPRKSYFTAGASTPSAGSGADQPMSPAPMPAEAPVAEAIAAPVPSKANVAAPVPAAAPAVAANSAAMPAVQAFVLPLGELAAVAQGSGLNWVNSDAAKIAAVQAAIAAEPKPVHVPRQRPAAPVLDEGPLVLVETQRDLRNMTLPFETNSSGT